jgi:hypothetical protein
MHIRSSADVTGLARVLEDMPDPLKLESSVGMTIDLLGGGSSMTVTAQVTEPDAVRQELASLDNAAISNVESTNIWFSEQYSNVRSHSEEILHTILWRSGLTNTTVKLAWKPIHISLDGIQWRSSPVDLSSLQFDMAMPYAPLNSRDMASLDQLMQQVVTEPLAHQLLREAWSQREVSPRSAVVLAVAAAEVGVKRYISNRVPEAEWLIVELQSPPVELLLRRYIEQLKPTCSLPGKPIRPPTTLIKAIKEGIELRNKIAHRGHTDVTKADTTELLLSVRDLLYIFDFYQGATWAIQNVRAETLSAWR